MTTELISKIITPEELFVPKGLDVILAGVKAKVDIFNKTKFDLNEKKDQDKIRSFAHNVAKSKKFVENTKIEYVRDKKLAIKVIDAESKRFCDSMDEIKTTVRKPLTDWEDAEKEQIEEEERLKQINIEHEEALQMHDLFKREEAMKFQQAEMDAKQKELDRIAGEQRLEKERIEREEQIKKESAEKSKRDAETARLKAETKLEEEKNRRVREAELAEEKRLNDIEAEKDRSREARKQEERENQRKIDQIKRRQEEKDRIEAKRIADEKAETDRLQKIEDARQADTEHRKKINQGIVKCLVNMKIDTRIAESVVKVAVMGQIPGLSVNY